MFKETENFCIKFDENKRMTGFLKTTTEKFYLGEDGVLTIVPIESGISVLAGLFKNTYLFIKSEEYEGRISKRISRLIYLRKTMLTNLRNQ